MKPKRHLHILKVYRTEYLRFKQGTYSYYGNRAFQVLLNYRSIAFKNCLPPYKW